MLSWVNYLTVSQEQAEIIVYTMLFTWLRYRIMVETQRFQVKMLIIFPCLSQKCKILAHHTDRLPLCVESGNRYNYHHCFSGKLALLWLYCYLEQVDGKSTVLSFPCAYLTWIYLFWDGTHTVHYQCWHVDKAQKTTSKSFCVKLNGRLSWDTITYSKNDHIRKSTQVPKSWHETVPFEIC